MPVRLRILSRWGSCLIIGVTLIISSLIRVDGFKGLFSELFLDVSSIIGSFLTRGKSLCVGTLPFDPMFIYSWVSSLRSRTRSLWSRCRYYLRLMMDLRLGRYPVWCRAAATTSSTATASSSRLLTPPALPVRRRRVLLKPRLSCNGCCRCRCPRCSSLTSGEASSIFLVYTSDAVLHIKSGRIEGEKQSLEALPPVHWQCAK